MAANNCFTPANGLASATFSAIHGEYSKIFASAVTKSALLHALRSESGFFDMARPLSDLARVGGKMREIGVPVLRDLQPRRHPDAVVSPDVVEKAHQGRGAAGTSDDPAMQADRHHLRRGRAFGIEHVETILEIGEELIAAAEPLRIDEAHVVGIEAVGNDQMRSGRS